MITVKLKENILPLPFCSIVYNLIIWQKFSDSTVTIFLPESSADDVAEIINVALDVESTTTEVDEKFVDKFYWIDVKKIFRIQNFQSKCVEPEHTANKSKKR